MKIQDGVESDSEILNGIPSGVVSKNKPKSHHQAKVVSQIYKLEHDQIREFEDEREELAYKQMMEERE